MVVTPEEIIEYNRTLILDDSGGFRWSGIYGLRQFPRTIFLVIYWYFRTHWYDIKTRRLYDNMPTDSDYWIILGENPDNSDQVCQKYRDWLDQHEIRYRILWFRHFMQYSFVFENKEDVVKFEKKWEWIDRGEYVVQLIHFDVGIFDWINLNCEGDHKYYSKGMISFQNEFDAVAFKLMWI